MKAEIERVIAKYRVYQQQQPRVFTLGTHVDAKSIERENALIDAILNDLSALLAEAPPAKDVRKAQRYDLITNYRCGGSIEEMEPSDNGDWVRWEDVAVEAPPAHEQVNRKYGGPEPSALPETQEATGKEVVREQLQALRDEFYAALVIMRNYYAQAISRAAVDEVLERGRKFIEQTDAVLASAHPAQAWQPKEFQAFAERLWHRWQAEKLHTGSDRDAYKRAVAGEIKDMAPPVSCTPQKADE